MYCVHFYMLRDTQSGLRFKNLFAGMHIALAYNLFKI